MLLVFWSFNHNEVVVSRFNGYAANLNENFFDKFFVVEQLPNALAYFFIATPIFDLHFITLWEKLLCLEKVCFMQTADGPDFVFNLYLKLLWNVVFSR